MRSHLPLTILLSIFFIAAICIPVKADKFPDGNIISRAAYDHIIAQASNKKIIISQETGERAIAIEVMNEGGKLIAYVNAPGMTTVIDVPTYGNYKVKVIFPGRDALVREVAVHE
ncbi:MAG: hypothetical protein HY064_07340 [Bacteroidetes bacterium]|nr:hypothetical protein [Bacteroidota bacterium]